MIILNELYRLRDKHASIRDSLHQPGRRCERYFDYEVEDQITQVLEEVIGLIESESDKGWTVVTSDLDTRALYGKYFVTIKYNHLPSTYNQVKEAKYDHSYHAFVHASNGRPFISDMEVIAYRPYNRCIPLPYTKEVTV